MSKGPAHASLANKSPSEPQPHWISGIITCLRPVWSFIGRAALEEKLRGEYISATAVTPPARFQLMRQSVRIIVMKVLLAWLAVVSVQLRRASECIHELRSNVTRKQR